MLVLPGCSFPSITIPPPTPVPIITPKTTSNPLATPILASAIAKQFASFSIDIFFSSLFSRSSLSDFPIKHCVLLFLINPVCLEIAPGVQIPKEKSEIFVDTSKTRDDIALIISL